MSGHLSNVHVMHARTPKQPPPQEIELESWTLQFTTHHHVDEILRLILCCGCLCCFVEHL